MDAPGSTDAGVLVPLYLDKSDLHAVFTRRRDDLRRHAGEISFPGGRQDFPDEDLRVTALREAEEEIGLARDEVDLVGALPPVGTFVTGYRIHPFVGVIRPGHAWTLQPDEVDEVLELSLRALLLIARHRDQLAGELGRGADVDQLRRAVQRLHDLVALRPDGLVAGLGVEGGGLVARHVRARRTPL